MHPYPNATMIGSAAAPAVTTFNPADKTASVGLTAGNLTATLAGIATASAGVRSTTSKSSGKYHWEITVGSSSGNWPLFGLANASQAMSNKSAGDGTHNSIEYQGNSAVFMNGGNLGSGDTFTTGSVIALEADFSTQQLWVQKVGGTGRKGPFSFTTVTGPYFIYLEESVNGDAASLNCGQSAFAITPTSGFSAWG